MRGWCGTLRLCITYASPWRYFLRQVSRSTLCFLPYIERTPIQRSSRQGQSVKIFPTCETDERYGGLKLVDRAMFETRATVVRNLRSRFGKKDSRVLER